MSLEPFFKLPKGAIIKCPNPLCPDPIITRTVRELRPGDKLKSEVFDKQYGQGVEHGQRCTCKACNHHWLINTEKLTRIHTARGWYPDEGQFVEGLNVAKGKK